ncbi:MAG: TonB-dependent receptor [Rhizomicrobium sp.]|nr:TonB-dependent receptor [Rhizomicrobium sp.]
MSNTKNARARLLGTTVLAGLGLLLAAAPAIAQESMETVTVTGYRASLTDSTNAKRSSVGFSDSIFSEDIGKFPDTNIAEAFNRIPGVTISRENDGSGLRVAIRGLDTNFVKITLNGAVVSTASTGGTDSSGSNREVDLNIFPIELFSQLTVSKTASAEQLEGGASGVIAMRSLRPFDHPGTHFSYNVQASDYARNGNPGGRGSLIGSWTDGPFGALVGVSGQWNRVMVTGYEGAFNSVTTPNLNATQYGVASCGSNGNGNINTCNSLGGNTDWSLPTTYPNTGVPSSYVGQTITKDNLLALNPGLTIDQVTNATVPRTGRPMFEKGTRNRYNGILSLEYRPSDELHFYFDSILGVIENNLDREDMFWIARNGNSIPMNMKVDANNVVTSAKFANAAMELEARPYKEKSDYFSLNPGMDWQVTDLVHVDGQLNYSRAHFFRDSPTFKFATTNAIVNYDNTGSTPTFSMEGLPNSGGLQNPANFVWSQGDLAIQQERRYQFTKGAHVNASYGGDEFKLTVGAAYDEAYRLIRGYDNSNAFKSAGCNVNPSIVLPAPNSTYGCSDTPTAYAYPGYGTGYTAGWSAITYGGSKITTSQISNYLTAGPNGFVKANYAALKSALNYDYYSTHPSNGAATNLQDPGRTNFSTGTNTNISSGIIDEKTQGYYAEISGTFHRGDQKLKYNFGGRWVRTLQALTGYTSVADPRNATLSDGGKYPNTIVPATLSGSYSAFLPSANAVWEITDDFQLRAAVSRSMSRADPSKMLPQLTGGGSDASSFNLGNPNLKPYYSTNIDFGAEFYTGGEGYIGIGVFKKMVRGFQNNISTTQPFSYLAQFGITYDTLSSTQKVAITAAGGPTVATVTIVQAMNAKGLESINGVELNWVQPLDFLLESHGLKGFGWQANATFVKTKSSGAAPAAVLNVSPTTYNLTGYYENDGAMVKLSYSYQRGTLTNSNAYGTISNRLDFTSEYSLDYGTVDLSSSLALSKFFGDLPTDPQLTFDVQNLTHAKVGRSYKQYQNLMNYSYNPGSLFLIGVRGSL